MLKKNKCMEPCPPTGHGERSTGESPFIWLTCPTSTPPTLLVLYTTSVSPSVLISVQITSHSNQRAPGVVLSVLWCGRNLILFRDVGGYNGGGTQLVMKRLKAGRWPCICTCMVPVVFVLDTIINLSPPLFDVCLWASVLSFSFIELTSTREDQKNKILCDRWIELYQHLYVIYKRHRNLNDFSMIKKLIDSI